MPPPPLSLSYDKNLPPLFFLSTNTTFFEHYTSWEKPKGKSQIDDYVGSIQTHPVTVAASLLQTESTWHRLLLSRRSLQKFLLPSRVDNW